MRLSHCPGTAVHLQAHAEGIGANQAALQINSIGSCGCFSIKGALAKLLAVVIILMIGAIGSRAPSFVSPGNLVEMFNDTAIL
ncbi:hypothetical protein FK521_30385, partial [Klebsiella pneumoniae]|nr:hypothetical protein [Klebsiella pneumoniae]